MTILELFDTIKNEPRSSKKIEYIRAFKDKELLIKILVYTYSNDIIFGINGSSIKIPITGASNEVPIQMYDDVLKANGRNLKIKIITSYLMKCNRKLGSYLLNVFDKDLNIGINKKLINKAFGYELIPDFSIMLAFKQDEKRWLNNFAGLDWCYFNIKVDGARCVIYVNSYHDIKFFSRDGKPLQDFLTQRIREEIQKNIEIFEGYILDGEIYSNFFQKLMRILNRKNITMDSIYIRNSVKFAIFDLINLEKLPLIERVNKLTELSLKLGKNPVIMFLSYHKVKIDYKLIAAIARYYIDKGAEGIIIKNPNSLYERKRSNHWLKFKDKNTIDLKIIGVYEGEKGTQFENALGGIITKYKNTELRCGSGFTEEERIALWAMKDDLIGQTVELSYMEETKTGSLRHPVFEKIRFDKEGDYDE